MSVSSRSICFHYAVCCLKIQTRLGRGMFTVVRCSKKHFKKTSELQLIINNCSLKTKGNGTISWWHSWSGRQHRSG